MSLGGVDQAMLGVVLYVGALGLVLLGMFAVVTMRHLVRIVLGLTLMEAGVNLFLVATGYRPDAAAPILVGGVSPGPMVDPVPQALILTSIVIGVGVLAVALALVIQVHRAYGTLDTRAVAERLAAEDPATVSGPTGVAVATRRAGLPQEPA